MVGPVRILIADDHRSVRENLRDLLNAEPGLAVVALATDGQSALRLVRSLRPDVLVLDNDLPDFEGLTVARVLRHELVAPRIVLYTMERGLWGVAALVGVDVCVSKDDPPQRLIMAIRMLGRPLERAPALVLIVEDDFDARELMCAALTARDLEIVEARDALDALAKCQHRPPGVVVLDLGLPDMSGQEFVAAYRRMHMQAAPIVVVSGAQGARQIATELGAAAFVAKPFSIDDLADAVRRLTPAPA